jgi:hypothetical protein
MHLCRWAIVAVFGLAVGCSHQQVRSQKADEAEREPEVRTVGDLTAVSNAGPIQVIGVGLVTNLAGTGGGVPPGNERGQLEDELKKAGVTNINDLFTSKTTSLVRVAATIPPGARKADPVDVYVTVPEGCRTTSLRGGKLEVCYLYSFESTHNLSADPTRPNRLLRGHALMKAEGAVLAGLPMSADDDTPSQKAGKVWAGGKVLTPDRPFILEMTPPSVKASVGVAARINETFHGPGSSAAPIAAAKNDTHVILSVPGPYRLNMGRFLRVVRLIPLDETPRADGHYPKKLEKQLLDPGTCVTAALRLEALGTQSIPVLKMALQSDYPMVRFAAAESLAYLGSPACAEELATQAVEQPFVQAYALTALASLNEAACRVKLSGLLAADQPEVRYGAFRALRALDDRDPVVAGEKVGEHFWLHRVAPDSPTQVHASTGKRAEVVIFGPVPTLDGPCSILADEFTLTAKDGEPTCTLSRYTVRRGKQTKQCPRDLGEVLKAVGELGGSYADALEVLRQADQARALACSVKFDALPKAPPVHELAKAGRGDSRPGSDAGPGPSLYDPSETARAALAAGAR